MTYQRLLELRQRNRYANARVYSAYTVKAREANRLKAFIGVVLGLLIVACYLLASNIEYRDQNRSINAEQQQQAAAYADARTWYHEQCDLDVDKVVCTPNTELQQ